MPSTFVQLLSNYFNEFAKPAFWFFIVMATNAFVMPDGVALRFKFWLSKAGDDTGYFSRAVCKDTKDHLGYKWSTGGTRSGFLIASMFKILAGMMVVSLAFVEVDPNEPSISPLTQALGKAF